MGPKNLRNQGNKSKFEHFVIYKSKNSVMSATSYNDNDSYSLPI